MRPTTAISNRLTFLASWGQIATHRMQQMQRFLSTWVGSFTWIAPTGHSAAHTPHFTQAFVALGTTPALAALR